MLGVTLFLFVFVFGLSFYANSPYFFEIHDFSFVFPFDSRINFNNNADLGSEYFELALSLAVNEGFSNPFLVPTGPSAWMPPIYPSLLALFLKLTEDRQSVMWIVLCLKNLVIVGTGVLVFWVARETCRWISPWWVIAIFCCFILTNFPWFFQTTHDIWFLLLLMNCLLFFGVSIGKSDALDPRGQIYWGGFGGLIALTSPVLATTWFCATAILSFWQKSLRVLVVPTLCVSLCVAPWVLRNYMVFGKFIPMKSNLFFDLYFSSVVAEGGVYTNETFDHHPYTISLFKEHKFKELGWSSEQIIVGEAKAKFLENFAKDKLGFFGKVVNRFLAATVHYRSFFPAIEPNPHWLKRVLYVFPFLGFLVCLVSRRWGRVELFSFSIYLFYLLPYIIVAFYVRYLLPLTPILVLFVMWAVDELGERFFRDSNKATVPGVH